MKQQERHGLVEALYAPASGQSVTTLLVPRTGFIPPAAEMGLNKPNDSTKSIKEHKI